MILVTAQYEEKEVMQGRGESMRKEATEDKKIVVFADVTMSQERRTE
jgi:hypothetical protein